MEIRIEVTLKLLIKTKYIILTNIKNINMNMKQTNLKMPIELIDNFKILSEQKGIAVSKLIRHSMELYISEDRKHSIEQKDTLLMPVSLKLAKQIEREDIHSICLLNGICSELWNAYLVKIGYSVQPIDILHAAQQILGCGLSLEDVYDDRQRIVNDYTEHYIKQYKN